MKANHNRLAQKFTDLKVVTNLIISKNESKSQQALADSPEGPVVTNLIISKNESKSQQNGIPPSTPTGCYQSHYFKE